MVDIRNLKAIEKLKGEKLNKEIEDFTVDWIKKGRCPHNRKLKGRRRDYILYRMRPCKCLEKAYIKKFEKEIDERFKTTLAFGTIKLEKTLGQKFPELRDAVEKGDF